MACLPLEQSCGRTVCINPTAAAVGRRCMVLLLHWLLS
jgi:hypothetical protein